MKSHSQEFKVYANRDLRCEVCAANSMSLEDIVRRTNKENPTLINRPWILIEEEFPNGQPNPYPCPDSPETHKHYLFGIQFRVKHINTGQHTLPEAQARFGFRDRIIVESCPYCGCQHAHYSTGSDEGKPRMADCLQGEYLLRFKERDV